MALALSMAACLTGPGAAAGDYSRPAVFEVEKTVINPDLQAFSATIGGIGNGGRLLREGGAFEPIILRGRYVATRDHPDRVYEEPRRISRYDTLREGALDGAEVYVYRIENGTLSLVREDRVAQGGHKASGWRTVSPHGRMLTETRFSFQWDNWNRPGVPSFFAVRTIDRNGRRSRPSDVLQFVRPEKITRRKLPAPATARPPKPAQKGPSPLAPPAGLTGRLDGAGVLTLTWSPQASDEIAGYEVLKSQTPPQDHQGFYFQLENAAGSSPIRTGDWVVLHKTITDPSRRKYVSDRVWNEQGSTTLVRPPLIRGFGDEDPKTEWHLAPHEAGTPVENPGATYLKAHLRTTNPMTMRTFNHAGRDQNYYPVLHAVPYTVELWAKVKQKGRGKIRFAFAGEYDPKTPIGIRNIDFYPDTTWRKYSAQFTPRKVLEKGRIGLMLFHLLGPGEISIDNLRVYRSDAPFLSWAPENLTAIREARIGALRTHAFIKTGDTTYDLAQFTNQGGAMSAGGAGGRNTLPQSLKLAMSAETIPWLQVEPHFTPAEWRGLIEYLAAPFDPLKDSDAEKPWAAKRYRQGRHAPWTDAFDKIMFEVGNETWNGLFWPWIFPTMRDSATGERVSGGAFYGMYQSHVLREMQKSPYWKSEKLDEKLQFVLGGWAANPAYGLDAYRYARTSDYVAIAAYNGGWDQKEGPVTTTPEGYFSVLNQVTQVAQPEAQRMRDSLRRFLTVRDPVRLATYEAGPGYALNGLNNTRVTPEQVVEQELVMKGLAAGVATLDAFLLRARMGFAHQNFFTFSRGQYWKSHARWYHGGHAYPSWKLISLFNRQGRGDMLRIATRSVPSTDLPKTGGRPAVKDAPMVAAYATAADDRLNLFLLSRKIPDYPIKGDRGTSPVTVHLPFQRADKVTLYRMTGKHDDHNVDADRVGIETVDIDPRHVRGSLTVRPETGGSQSGLPAASAFLYVFKGLHGD